MRPYACLFYTRDDGDDFLPCVSQIGVELDVSQKSDMADMQAIRASDMGGMGGMVEISFGLGSPMTVFAQKPKLKSV